MVGAEGGAPKQGCWIYFRSDRSGRQIWKAPAAAPFRPAVQVTQNGGFEAAEAADGKLLYYSKPGSGLWSMPVEGGEERLVSDRVETGLWGRADKGVFYTRVDHPQKPLMIEFLSFARRQSFPVALTDKRVTGNGPNFDASQDGPHGVRWTVMSRT